MKYVLLVRISDDEKLQQLLHDRNHKGGTWFDPESFSSLDYALNLCCANQQVDPILVHRAEIFTKSTIVVNYNLATYQCRNCKEVLHFDGRDVGLVNVKNLYLFSCELFYELLNLKSTSGLSTNAW